MTLSLLCGDKSSDSPWARSFSTPVGRGWGESSYQVEMEICFTAQHLPSRTWGEENASSQPAEDEIFFIQSLSAGGG